MRALKRRRDAFTLLELMVVVAVITVLAALLLPAILKSRATAQSATCWNNLRQLGYGFFMYVEENADVFPTGAARSALGAHPEDWVWWQNTLTASGDPAMRDPGQGSVVRLLGSYDPRLLRCPSDKDAPERELLWRQNPGLEQFFYSYSFNGHSERGMATHITRDRSVIFRNKLSTVRSPSTKIMLVEERGGSRDGPGSAVIDDGQWVPPGYPLTTRHRGHANVTFADGHVRPVKRESGDSEHPERYDPAY